MKPTLYKTYRNSNLNHQEIKIMATRKTPKRKAATKAAPKAAGQAAKGLVSSLAKSWKEISAMQIDFAQENADEYFATLRKMADAKNPQESMAVYGRFTVDAVKRQVAQTREIGSVVSNVQKDVAGRLAKLRPGSKS